MIRIENIDRQINIVRADMDAAKRDHAEASLKVHEAPADKELQEQLESLEREIEGHQRKIKRLEAAKAEAARLDTAEAKAAELARMKGERTKLEERMTRQREIAGALVASIDALGPMLAEYETLAQDNQSAAWTLLRGGYGGDIKKAERVFPAIVAAVRGASARAGVINALYASGLGRTGIALSPWVEVGRCEAKRALDEEMRYQGEVALETLSRAIARREAELAGKLPAESVPTQETRFIKGGRMAGDRAASFVALNDAGRL